MLRWTGTHMFFLFLAEVGTGALRWCHFLFAITADVVSSMIPGQASWTVPLPLYKKEGGHLRSNIPSINNRDLQQKHTSAGANTVIPSCLLLRHCLWVYIFYCFYYNRFLINTTQKECMRCLYLSFSLFIYLQYSLFRGGQAAPLDWARTLWIEYSLKLYLLNVYYFLCHTALWLVILHIENRALVFYGVP